MTARMLAALVPLLSFSYAVAGQASARIVELPINVVEGYVMVKGRINHSDELTFLFDTGCTEPVVHTATADRLGLFTEERTRSSGRGTFTESIVPNAKLAFGSLVLDRRRLLRRSNDMIERRMGIAIDGVIGADLLRDFVVAIDYDRRVLTLYEAETFRYEGDGAQIAIDANPYLSTLHTELLIEEGDSTTVRFLIDTGAGLPLALNTPFVNDNDLVARIGAPEIEYRLAAYQVEMKSHPGRVAGLSLGDHVLKEIPVMLSQTAEGPLSPGAIAGIIGNEIWSRFSTVYDYSRDLLYLEPNSRLEEPFRVDCSGLALENRADGTVQVTGVLPNSPASDAGFVPGDEVLVVNAKPAGEVPLHELRRLLRDDGSIVVFVVHRDGRQMEMSLTLRALY